MTSRPPAENVEDITRALGEAGEREAATRKILEVVRRSRRDVAPVFDVILESALRLCKAQFGLIFLGREGDAHLRLVAERGIGSAFIEKHNENPTPLDRNLAESARAVLEQTVVQIDDMVDSQLYRDRQPNRVSAVEDAGMRTALFVPLISGNSGIGVICVYRREVRRFEPKYVDLVSLLAEQAVIAIENAQQFRELQTRLEHEAATRDILQVISQSRADDKPVFDVILNSAAKLCHAPLSLLFLRNEANTHLEVAAQSGSRSNFVDLMKRDPLPLDPKQSLVVRALLERRVVHIEDVSDDQLYRDRQPHRVHGVEVEGIRTLLHVPLISGDDPIGVITLYRREVRPFENGDIELVKTFAEQAVIAIENAQQFRELQTRLEHEVATREILQVISQSRADDRPVFDVILNSAAKLCHAPLSYLILRNEANTHLEVAAHSGSRSNFVEVMNRNPLPLDPEQSLTVRALFEKRVLQIRDLKNDQLYRDRQPHRLHAVDTEGIRTLLVVPLVSGDEAIGAISLYRREVQPFEDGHIELVKTFAEQAVIAIENVKQFKALEARTEEVRAQADALRRLNNELETRVTTQVDELERLGRLRRFLSPQVADAVVSSGDDKLLGSHRALIAILFCDMRGFTAFCETAEPEEAIEILQTYHEAMGKLIHEHGAGVDHRAGDGIMAIFNDPLPCDDPAGDALRMAMAMRERMADLCMEWRKLGHRLGFGVGISLGYATVGMVGSEGRYDYTASGTAVNLAARLCDQAGDGEILLSPRAYRAVEDLVEVESAGELTLKGIQAPVDVVRVTRLKRADEYT